MRTQAEWEKHYQLMKAAKALADLARLELDVVESFREDHPDFVPAVWWAESNWLQERNLLLKAWRAGFPADLTLKLTTSRLFGVAHILASAGIYQAYLILLLLLKCLQMRLMASMAVL